MATILFNSQGGQIRVLLSNSIVMNISESLAIIAVWFFFTVITYGISVPAGLFLPAIILGCQLGQLYQSLTIMLNPMVQMGSSFMIVGAAAVLSAYTRQTYSIAVIMLETTQNINLFLPITLAILVSSTVGNLFNSSVYHYSLEIKGLPILSDRVTQR